VILSSVSSHCVTPTLSVMGSAQMGLLKVRVRVRVCVCVCVSDCGFRLIALSVWYVLSHAVPGSTNEKYCELIGSTYQGIIATAKLNEMPFAKLESKSKPTSEQLQAHLPTDDIYFQLAASRFDNEVVKKIYNTMMSMAKLKDWNTCTDEDVCPQLKKISCAALACFLKHTGQLENAKESRTRPKKALVDVYRSVFALRRTVFANRPIKNSEDEDESQYNTVVEEFETTCNLICSRLFFIMLMINPVINEGSDRILPLTFSGSKPKLTRSKRVGSPSAISPNRPGFFRLASQPGPTSQSEYDMDRKSDSVDFASVSTEYCKKGNSLFHVHHSMVVICIQGLCF